MFGLYIFIGLSAILLLLRKNFGRIMISIINVLFIIFITIQNMVVKSQFTDTFTNNDSFLIQ